MAFKSVKQYNDERYKNLLVLKNDGDYADVIFLYRSYNDVLVGDVHYIKSGEYSGYVQCIGRGCPVCGKGIRVQQKLFIPVYNIAADEIQFFDRSMKFEAQLSADIFDKYPNPSEFVFRIRRSGVANDVNTTYSMQAIGKNTVMSYDEIFAKFNLVDPDYYEIICKDYPADKLSSLLNSNSDSASSDLPNYQVTPRVSAASMIPEVHDTIPQPSILPDNMLPADEDEDAIEDLDGEEPLF